MTSKQIISLLPYQEPFLFVDAITAVSENNITGQYLFRENAFFYAGHFKNNPVTPGVILTECMAQIGLVSLGIYLAHCKKETVTNTNVALTGSQIDFFLPVMPKELVTVYSEKIYFRFNKLKCRVSLKNAKNELVCRGVISGMIKSSQNET
ncbi:3-hydroxyacyl-ACP dehydratase FabZ family protein [Bizionia sediminis]|uniref:3-hydroxyacyl-ACP dehydratase FabZ family protein n=1 Tax=Bizionia sediminis TaxID=1737064 RepID=A0ABW5KWL5_9FLAO